MFDRVVSLIGIDNLKRIENVNVLVVGLGGVGGYSVEALVRSGIKNIILIDYDKIDITNLNRQIITSRNNIDCFKVDEVRNRILSINPECNIITHQIFLNKKTIDILDNYQIDYIIDACDSVETKKLLIDYSLDNDIKLISCMGTANKLEPSKLEIIDIRKTSYDPLAKILRKYVVDKKINKKIMVVSSTEVPVRRDCLSSMIFVPASAGLLCAKYVIDEIIDMNK